MNPSWTFLFIASTTTTLSSFIPRYVCIPIAGENLMGIIDQKRYSCHRVAVIYRIRRMELVKKKTEINVIL